MNLIILYLVGIVGVFAHILTRAMRKGHTLKVLSTYWNTNSLDVILSIIIYTILFSAWQWSNMLSFMGWEQGHVNGAVGLLGYFSQSIIGHLRQQQRKDDKRV